MRINFNPIGPQPITTTVSPVLNARFVNAAQNAGQRLGHGRIHKRDAFGNFEHVLANDSAGNANVFGIRAIVEEQIFAEIRLALAAEEARVARRRIRGQHAHALVHAAVHRAALLFDHARQLMSEKRGRLNHPRVKALFPDFQIRAARQRHFHAHQHFVIARARGISTRSIFTSSRP